MIKDFNTYIREGRMGRLLNGDATGVRKQDLSDAVIEELKDILLKAYSKEESAIVSKKRLLQFMEWCKFLPVDDEWPQIVKDINKHLDMTMMEEPAVDSSFLSFRRQGDLTFEYTAYWRKFYKRNGVKHISGRIGTFLVQFNIEYSKALDQDIITITVHADPTSAWSQRLEALLGTEAKEYGNVIYGTGTDIGETFFSIKV